MRIVIVKVRVSDRMFVRAALAARMTPAKRRTSRIRLERGARTTPRRSVASIGQNATV